MAGGAGSFLRSHTHGDSIKPFAIVAGKARFASLLSSNVLIETWLARNSFHVSTSTELSNRACLLVNSDSINFVNTEFGRRTHN